MRAKPRHHQRFLRRPDGRNWNRGQLRPDDRAAHVALVDTCLHFRLPERAQAALEVELAAGLPDNRFFADAFVPSAPQ